MHPGDREAARHNGGIFLQSPAHRLPPTLLAMRETGERYAAQHPPVCLCSLSHGRVEGLSPVLLLLLLLVQALLQQGRSHLHCYPPAAGQQHTQQQPRCCISTSSDSNSNSSCGGCKGGCAIRGHATDMVGSGAGRAQGWLCCCRRSAAHAASKEALEGSTY